MQETDYGKVIAANIRAERARQMLSQADIADQMRARKLPWGRQTVGMVEREHRRLTVEELIALADIFGTTLDELTGPYR